MTTQTAIQTPATATPTSAECTECSGAIRFSATLPGEILDCPDCGAELEVRSVSPLVLALAPQVEEDWGE
jgi:alpha-aminoadipate/glutamate carrier protein LysW